MDNLRCPESLGVIQKLVKFLPERQVTVVEFIPGYVLKNQDFLTKDLWKKVIRPIKLIHPL